MTIQAQKLEKLIMKNRSRFSLASLLLRATAKSEDVRSAMLSFVDVLPSLRDHREVAEYLTMYLEPVAGQLPAYARTGLTVARDERTAALAGAVTRHLVERHLAPRFIVDGDKALKKTARRYTKDGSRIVFDLLGELVVSWDEADEFTNAYIEAMKNPPVRPSGNEPFHIAVKLSSLYPYYNPERYEQSVREVYARLAEILRAAKENNAFVTVDAEHWQLCKLGEEIFRKAMFSREFHDWPNMGIALQAYRRDAMKSAQILAVSAGFRAAPVTVRLIKGAYWDTELIEARQHGWPFPLWEQKHQTDRNFERVCDYLMRCPRVNVAAGTHNPESIAYAVNAACLRADAHRQAGAGGVGEFEVQVLHGLGEPIRRALAKLDIPVRVYMPYGDIQKGMSYFARRILENTSNAGFMTQLIR